MATDRLDLGDLGRLVAAERKRRGISLRDAASEIGIPFNTFARVEKGHIPDLPKFKRLVEWCGADISQFFEARTKTATTADLIAEHLRTDRNLTPEAAEQIAGVVNDLYQALARPQTVLAVHLRAASTFRPAAAHELGELISDMYKVLQEEVGNGPEKRV